MYILLSKSITLNEIISSIQSDYYNLVNSYFGKDNEKLLKKFNPEEDHPLMLRNHVVEYYENIPKIFTNPSPIKETTLTYRQNEIIEFCASVTKFWKNNRELYLSKIHSLKKFKLLELDSIESISFRKLNRLLYFDNICTVDTIWTFVDTMNYHPYHIKNEGAIINFYYNVHTFLNHKKLLVANGKLPNIILIPLGVNDSDIEEQKEQILIIAEELKKIKKKLIQERKRFTLYEFLDELELHHIYGEEMKFIRNLKISNDPVENLIKNVRRVFHIPDNQTLKFEDALYHAISLKYMDTLKIQEFSSEFNLDYGFQKTTLPYFKASHKKDVSNFFKALGINKESTIATYFNEQVKTPYIDDLKLSTFLDLQENDHLNEFKQVFNFNLRTLKGSDLEDLNFAFNEINNNISEAFKEHQDYLETDNSKKLLKKGLIRTTTVGLTIGCFAFPYLAPLAVASAAIDIYNYPKDMYKLWRTFCSESDKKKKIFKRPVGILMKSKD